MEKYSKKESIEYYTKISKECQGHNWTNMEQNETLRGIFVDDTKLNLWFEQGEYDAGFSEEYVLWLEKIIFELTKV